MGSRKRVTLACAGQFREPVWGALREAEVSELSMTDTVSRCTFEFTTEDLDAILSRSIFEVCNVQVSVADA